MCFCICSDAEAGAIIEAGIGPPEIRDLLKSRAISEVPLKASPQG